LILDSSVLVAMLLDEPGRALLINKIGEAESVGVAAPSLVEAGIVLSARLRRCECDSQRADYLRGYRSDRIRSGSLAGSSECLDSLR
jgi:uncharacterized protein with PIN domain